MIWSIIFFITLAGSLLYYYYVYLAWQGLRVVQTGMISNHEKVSVVVAARDEENNIGELLTRLINQNYAQEDVEIIIANDGSKDKTGEIIKRYSMRYDNIRQVKVEQKAGKVSRKKNALQQAIELARGEIILITDADCSPGRNWIKLMTAGFEPSTAMVAGLSRTELKAGFKPGSARWFEHFDFLAMFAMAGGLIKKGKYFSCSAQNLGFRKSCWEEVGGYQRIMHLESGDDVNLMQLFRKAEMEIRFNLVPGSFMTTKPISDWLALFNQRSRWASNTRFQFSLNPEFFLYLMSVLLVTFMPWVVLAVNWHLGLSLLLLRIVLEMQFVKFSLGKFRADEKLWLSYPLWFIIQPIYMVIVAVGGFFSIYQWKK